YKRQEVKRAVVGTGHALKEQVADMVRRLLPGVRPQRADAADALAVAICHGKERRLRRLGAGTGGVRLERVRLSRRKIGLEMVKRQSKSRPERVP
ncbi:MAG: crossover junction endodeoxyribonuclease RuvC, partial [Dehalococcoidia bacterium]|nr:crossover junction endodeoxyribonuclease RuvC [Dehalococcoidia bacterium]